MSRENENGGLIQYNPKTGREITSFGAPDRGYNPPDRQPVVNMEKTKPEPTTIPKYNLDMAQYTSPLQDQSDFDRQIQGRRQGSPMSVEVCRKSLPNDSWSGINELLKNKKESNIPTVGETGDFSSLEAIDTRDLKIGNILAVATYSTELGDIRGESGKGWKYTPYCYAFEVIENGNPNSTSLFRTKLVKEITPNHPLFPDPILQNIHGEGYVFNPLIAKGLDIQFADKNNQGYAPTTAPVQHILVFADRAEFESYVAKKQIDNTTSGYKQIK